MDSQEALPCMLQYEVSIHSNIITTQLKPLPYSKLLS